eukprot:gnl/Trimastix_PCT/1434.p1 GENE.gnl/Trimastix_PCT/1434~~gnl/Trimastix_PCT/1434.p1  ORF type:complete len:982 (+),score=230.15 gnl/Trimastix_PCT/1434:57-2948(+)
MDPQDGFLDKHVRVDPGTAEFAAVEYQLHLALRTTSPKIVTLWSIASPQLSVDFKQKTGSMTQLDSWVDTATLDEHNSIYDICRKGFTFSEKGRGFTTGSIRLDRDGAGKKRYEFILCRIGIGFPFCYEPPPQPEVSAPPLRPPEGYDSLYIHRFAPGEPQGRDKDDRAFRSLNGWADNTEGTTSYEHEYVLFDQNQVLPLYLIHFEYDPADDDPHKLVLCDVCEQAPATIYCPSDNAKLCVDCDEEIHRANKLMARHVRVPLSESHHMQSFCPHHPTNVVEFFCPECAQPVCVHCKMIGSHSSGQAATHRLVPVSDAYNAYLTESKQPDPLIENRRSGIRDQLMEVDEKLREVTKKHIEVEDQIYQRMQKVMAELCEATQSKMSILLSEELELRRQMGYIDWVEDFLRFQQERLPPVEFLTAWKRHSQLRGMLHGTHDLPRRAASVRADIRLNGQLSIATDQTAHQQHLAQQHEAVFPSGDAHGADPSSSPRAPLGFGTPLPGLGGSGGMGGHAGGGLQGPMGISMGSAHGGSSFKRALMSTLPSETPDAAAPAVSPQQPFSSLPDATGGGPSTLAPFRRESSELTPARRLDPMGSRRRPLSAQFSTGPFQLRAKGDTALDGHVPAASNPLSHDREGLALHNPAGDGDDVTPFVDVKTAWAQTLKGSRSRIQIQQEQERRRASTMPPQPGSVDPAHLHASIDDTADASSSLPAATPATALAAATSASASMSVALPAEPSPEDAGPEGDESPIDWPRPQAVQTPQARSMIAFALQRRRELLAEGLTEMQPFVESRILDRVQAQILYFNISLAYQAQTVLYYSTTAHPRSLAELHRRSDGHGQTVVVARVGSQVFGGYASTSWNMNGTRFGTPRSFLFSLTRDTRIPYKGNGEHSCCLWANKDSISWGGQDLVFKGDEFRSCTSTLERAYSIGLPAKDAKTFLAGKNRFQAEEVEVWGFQPPTL